MRSNEPHYLEPCNNPMKCVNCGEEHYSTSGSCKVWKREKEIITIKHRESLSFAEARQIIDARHALSASYSSVAKSSSAKTVNMKDAQTQTNGASVQTKTHEKQISSPAKTSKNTTVNRKPEKTNC